MSVRLEAAPGRRTGGLKSGRMATLGVGLIWASGIYTHTYKSCSTFLKGTYYVSFLQDVI